MSKKGRGGGGGGGGWGWGGVVGGGVGGVGCGVLWGGEGCVRSKWGGTVRGGGEKNSSGGWKKKSIGVGIRGMKKKGIHAAPLKKGKPIGRKGTAGKDLSHET